MMKKNTSRKNNIPSKTVEYVSLVEEDDPAMAPIHIIERIHKSTKQLEDLQKTCSLVENISMMNRKRKELDVYMKSKNIEINTDVIRMVKNLEELRNDCSEGKDVEPSKMADIYFKLGKMLNSQDTNIDIEEELKDNCPINEEMLQQIYKIVEDIPYNPQKKLKIEELKSKEQQLYYSVASEASRLNNISKYLEKLKDELKKTKIFSDNNFITIRDDLLADLKCISKEVSQKKMIFKNTNKTKFKNDIKKLRDWWQSEEDYVKSVITYHTYLHEKEKDIMTEDDMESFSIIAENAKKILINDRENHSNYRELSEFSQRKDYPLYIPLDVDFCLFHTDDDEYILLGNIQCHKVDLVLFSITIFFFISIHILIHLPKYKYDSFLFSFYSLFYKIVFSHGDATMDLLINALNDSSFETRFYAPKILCLFRKDGENILLFEKMYGQKITEYINEVYPVKISQDHVHEMVLSLSRFLEYFSLRNHMLVIKPRDIEILPSCSLYIHPHTFRNIISMETCRGKDIDDIGEPNIMCNEYHPDKIMKSNYHCVYVGWVLEALIFKTISSLDDNLGIMYFRNANRRDDKSDAFRFLIQKIYIPNASYLTRPIDSIRKTLTTITPSRELCQMSMETCDCNTEKNYMKRYRDLLSYEDSQVNLGKMDRRKDSHEHMLRSCITALINADIDKLTTLWKYKLTDERDTTESGNTLAYGPGPCREILRDFLEILLKHSLFLEIEGKLFFPVGKMSCKECHGNEDLECKFAGPVTINAIARATQLSMVMGIKWSKKLSKFALSQILLGKRETKATKEMCYDIFPLARNIASETNIYGDLQFNEEGQYVPYSLERVKEPFKLQNIIEIDKHFPAIKNTEGIAVTTGSLVSYLCKWLDSQMEKSMYIDDFRAGLGDNSTSEFWNLFYITPISLLDKMISDDLKRIDPSEFMRKIQLGKGFTSSSYRESSMEAELMNLRKKMFMDRFLEPSNDLERLAFIKALTGSNSLHIYEDLSVTISMISQEDTQGNPIMRNLGGIRFSTCAKTATFPYFSTVEEFNMLIECSFSLGKDYFTTS